MHTFAFVFSGLFLIAELVAFVYFLFVRYSKRDILHGRSMTLTQSYQLTKVLMTLAIAYPTMMIVISASLDSLNPVNAIYYFLAIAPVLCARAIKNSKGSETNWN